MSEIAGVIILGIIGGLLLGLIAYFIIKAVIY